MAKKGKKGKISQEKVNRIDLKIEKVEMKTINLKKGNKNDKIVAAILEAKVNNTWVKQKDDLSGTSKSK